MNGKWCVQASKVWIFLDYIIAGAPKIIIIIIQRDTLTDVVTPSTERTGNKEKQPNSAEREMHEKTKRKL